MVAAAVIILLALVGGGAYALTRGNKPAQPAPAPALHAASWHIFKHDPAILDLQPTSVGGQLLAEANGALQLVNQAGAITPYSIGPGGFSSNPGAEAYLAVSPGLHNAGATCDFPADVAAALKLTSPLGIELVDARGHVSSLANIPGVDGLNGIAFDTTGRFNHQLLVTAPSHGKTAVVAISCSGHVSVLNPAAPAMEGGIDIAPTGFGNYGGQLVAPDELSGKILAIGPDGTVSVVADSGLPVGQDIGVETAGFIPAGFMGRGRICVHGRSRHRQQPSPGDRQHPVALGR